MRLFIAEKPSLARSIAAVLSNPQQNHKLYIQAGDDIVAWAAGHLLEQAMPEAYDEKYKHWNLADLPIFPNVWKLLIKKESKDLFDNIKSLLKKAHTVVNAGDCDREGQLLIDEILDYCGYKGEVLRILISDTNPEAVRKALDNLKPDSDFHGDRDAALARSRADWLHGMNLTRLTVPLSELAESKLPLPLSLSDVMKLSKHLLLNLSGSLKLKFPSLMACSLLRGNPKMSRMVLMKRKGLSINLSGKLSLQD